MSTCDVAQPYKSTFLTGLHLWMVFLASSKYTSINHRSYLFSISHITLSHESIFRQNHKGVQAHRTELDSPQSVRIRRESRARCETNICQDKIPPDLFVQANEELENAIELGINDEQYLNETRECMRNICEQIWQNTKRKVEKAPTVTIWLEGSSEERMAIVNAITDLDMGGSP